MALSIHTRLFEVYVWGVKFGRMGKQPRRLLRKIRRNVLAWNYRDMFKSGMGIHVEQMLRLREEVGVGKQLQIVEFGSGQSTRFFEEVVLRENPGSSLTSFDHSPQWAWKSRLSEVEVKIRPLVSYSTAEWEQFFKDGRPPRENEGNLDIPLGGWKEERVFYRLRPEDLPHSADVALVDGPNGNGRAISFLFLAKIMKENSLILVDDLNHYDFEERLRSAFSAVSPLVVCEDRRVHPLFSWGLFRVSP